MTMSKDPLSGWDTEDRHLIGMPHSVREDPRTEKSGFLARLCNRCAAIPWAELPGDPRYAADGDRRPVIDERRQQLGDSPCRICHLLGTIKAFGWLKFIGCVPAAPGSHFKGRICFFPGEGVAVPKVAHPDLYGYLGILDSFEANLPFPRPTLDFVDLNIVRDWINDCTASHSTACQPDDTSKLQDLRVIDCETLLICSAPETFAYVALSYVWGPPSEFAEENYVFPSLPAQRSRTIEDAISVTKRLGFRYLWVDRYCINQNDPEHKMRQIRQMGAIYSSAALTIVAAAGNGPKHGLPGISLPRQVSMPYGQVVGSVALVLTTVAAVEDVYNTTWAYRAWTFQEGYLSRRRLFFTDSTMLYVCNQDMRSDIIGEDYMLGDIHGHRMLQLFVPWNSPMPAQDDWNVQSKNLNVAGRHMKAFSERRLTYSSDALNAILGILDHLS
ncbi:heterokaryon incompatibility protein-domain-containing protein, partial [Pyrenochaeta sp. MPI-SDFR-AT-0127]